MNTSHFLHRTGPATRLGWALMLMLGLATPNLDAIPARQGVIQLSQPDGTTVEARMYGDEYHHFFTTADGKPLLQGDDGSYTISDTDPE
ncbi:MAG: hypothetical protein K2L75_00355, partial [Muribaculaceae bacterium]|nr:hypothetical protein [Muribaculaceae bacterium]